MVKLSFYFQNNFKWLAKCLTSQVSGAFWSVPQPLISKGCLFPILSAGLQGFNPFPSANARSGSPFPPASSPASLPPSLIPKCCPPCWFLLCKLSHLILLLICLYGGNSPTPIPLSWGNKPPQYQGPPVPLMPDKALFCYICAWSHESLQVYSLVGGLV